MDELENFNLSKSNFVILAVIVSLNIAAIGIWNNGVKYWIVSVLGVPIVTILVLAVLYLRKMPKWAFFLVGAVLGMAYISIVQ